MKSVFGILACMVLCVSMAARAQVMSATCAPHLAFLEIAYDHSAATDKEFVGVEGANHGFAPCRPEFGDTFRRAFDYIDGWIGKPGRF